MAIKQSWLSNSTLVGTAKVIYEAKKQDSWGNWESEYRKEWPVDNKALRTTLHQEIDPGVEYALVQAEAALFYLGLVTR